MKKTKSLCWVGLLIVSFGAVCSGYSQSSLTTGLVAYYPFDGNANDATTNSNNGIPIDAVLATDRFGQANGAYAFDGISAGITAGNKPYLTFPNNGDFSISIWASLNTLPSPVMYFLGLDNGAGDQPKWIFAYGQLDLPNAPVGNYVSFLTTGGSNIGYALAAVPYTPALKVWHQYLITKAGSNYTVYIDGSQATGATDYENDNGVLKTVAGGPASIPAGITAPLTIGQAETGGYVNGKLDDVRIYDHALSATEVQQLYLTESGPRIAFVKAFTVDYSNLTIGSNYQLQASADMNNWTNFGAAFTATTVNYTNTSYQRIADWNQLFFRLLAVP